MMVAGLGDIGKAAAEALAKFNPLTGSKAPKPGEGPSREEGEAVITTSCSLPKDRAKRRFASP